MPYSTMKTWAVGDVWTAGDVNSYLRDNINQLRKYQTAGRTYSIGIANGTATAYTNALGVLTGIATFDEAFTMVIEVMGQSGFNGVNNVLNMRVVDEASAVITYGPATN